MFWRSPQPAVLDRSRQAISNGRNRRYRQGINTHGTLLGQSENKINYFLLLLSLVVLLLLLEHLRKRAP